MPFLFTLHKRFQRLHGSDFFYFDWVFRSIIEKAGTKLLDSIQELNCILSIQAFGRACLPVEPAGLKKQMTFGTHSGKGEYPTVFLLDPFLTARIPYGKSHTGDRFQ